MDNFDRNFLIAALIITLVLFSGFAIWTGFEFSKIIEAQTL